MRYRLPLVLIACVLVAASIPDEQAPDVTTEPESLQGTWLLTKSEYFDGKQRKVEKWTDSKRIRLIVSDRKLTITDDEEELVYECKITMAGELKAIDLALAGKRKNIIKAVYELENGTLRLCAHEGVDSEKRPTRLGTAPDTYLRLYTLVRDRKSKDR